MWFQSLVMQKIYDTGLMLRTGILFTYLSEIFLRAIIFSRNCSHEHIYGLVKHKCSSVWPFRSSSGHKRKHPKMLKCWP